MPGVPAMTISVASLRDASALCRAFIDYYELSGGNWTGGLVKRGRATIARVSYNGRIWNHPDGAEILPEGA